MEQTETSFVLFLVAFCVVALISHWLDSGDSFGDDLYN